MAFTLTLIENELLLETKSVLQNYARAVSSFSSQFIPSNKIRNENTLKVSHRGLTTQSIPYYDHEELIYFEMEIDFNMQSLWIRIGEEERQIPFINISESEFYYKVKELLNDLGFSLKIEMTTFNNETKHQLNPDAVNGVLKMLHFADYAFREFRSELNEITSSVQLYPQNFDLVMAVFCGQPVKTKNQITSDERFAFIKTGFSFGDDISPTPYFYVHLSHLPTRLKKKTLPQNTSWLAGVKNKIELPYLKIAESIHPIEEVVSFYTWVYKEYITNHGNK